MHIKFDENYISNSKYRVAMVVANGVQGDSRVIKTALTLSKLGFRVHLFGMSKAGESLLLEGYPFPVVLASNPAPQLKKEGLWFDENGEKNIPLFVECLARNIAECMKRHSFDILHTHDMYGLPLGALIKEKYLDPRTVWIHDLHEYVAGCTNIDEHVRLTMLEMEEKYIKGPDALTTVSPILSQLIVEHYGVAEPALILNAPRFSDFDPLYPRPIRKALGLKQDIPLLVYNGNVKPIRGVHFVVEALLQLPQAHLVLLTNSQGDYVQELIKRAEELGVSGRLHFHPYVPNHEVTSFVCGASVGVNPVSLYPNSDLALPNKVFEYLHSGTPIVSTATKAMSHFLEVNNCGLTFAEADVNSLASAILATLDLYPNGLPSAGHGSSLSLKYSWETQEEVIAQSYRDLVNKITTFHCIDAQLKVDAIVQLPTFAANQPNTLARAFRSGGLLAESASLGANGFRYQCDLQIKPQECGLSSIQNYLIDQKLDKYQTYHFHVRPLLFNRSFEYPTGLDLLLLKAMNKAVFFHYRGSEIRLSSIFKVATPYHYVDEQYEWTDSKKPYVFEEANQRAFREFVCGVCDDVFVNDPELQTYVPNALIVPRAISDDQIKIEKTKVARSAPLIVHAPSRRGVKGTEYVLSAIEKLREQGYIFEFLLVEDLPHEKALAIYEEADIIIDQLRIGWYGVLAVEGMALGKAVVTHIRHDLRHYLPSPPPLVYANPENITEVLEYLLLNPDAAETYGRRAMSFAREYHGANSIVKNLQILYKRPRRPIDPSAVVNFLGFQENNESINPPKEIHAKKSRKISNTRKYGRIKLTHVKKFATVVSDEGFVKAVKKTVKLLIR